MSTDPTIIYTLTDEAPLLATCALLPVIRTFTTPAGVRVETSDISVAARILGNFPEYLTPEQRVPDTLTELGKKTLEPDANIVCFRYAPHGRADLDSLQGKIRQKIVGDGSFYLVQTRLPAGLFLRTTLINPFTAENDLKDLLREIRNAGEKR